MTFPHPDLWGTARTASVNPPNPKQRYGDLKPNLALVPGSAVVYMALGLGVGGRKYGPFNWRDMPVEARTYVAACMRHLTAWFDGEELDPEEGTPHLGHAMACLAILVDAYECGKLIDNRPSPGPSGAMIRRLSAAAAAAASAADAPEERANWRVRAGRWRTLFASPVRRIWRTQGFRG